MQVVNGSKYVGFACICVTGDYSQRTLFLYCRVRTLVTSEDASLWLGLSPIYTDTPDGPLMLWNCFFSFAVEYLSCGATEPGFARDFGTIEIDWLIDGLTKITSRRPYQRLPLWLYTDKPVLQICTASNYPQLWRALGDGIACVEMGLDDKAAGQ